MDERMQYLQTSIQLSSENDNTFYVESGSIRIEILHWVELFFTLKAIIVVYLSRVSKVPHTMCGDFPVS